MSDQENESGNPKSRNPRKPLSPADAVRVLDPTEQDAIDAAIIAVNSVMREKVNSLGEVLEVPHTVVGQKGRVRYNVVKAFREKGWDVTSRNVSLNNVNTLVYDFKDKQNVTTK